MINYCDHLRKARNLHKQLSKCWFTNTKTSGLSVDFGKCPLMQITEDGKLDSKICPACYSATLLNLRTNLRNKLLNLGTPSLDEFEKDLRLVQAKLPEFRTLRFYSLGDFKPADLPYIFKAREYLRVLLISKTLVLKPEWLPPLFNVDNVWVSLSFNSNLMQHYDKITQMLLDNKVQNINLNYTLNFFDEDIKEISNKFNILHLRNADRRFAIRKWRIPAKQLCCILDGDGHAVKNHGSCHRCTKCFVGFSPR